MDTSPQRIAINCGGGYVPGPNAVVTGAVLAGSRLSTEMSESVMATTGCSTMRRTHRLD